jgi:hypothetical protein
LGGGSASAISASAGTTDGAIGTAAIGGIIGIAGIEIGRSAVGTTTAIVGGITRPVEGRCYDGSVTDGAKVPSLLSELHA